MKNLVILQLAQKTIMEKFVTNYNKDGEPRRTAPYYLKRLKDFQGLWNEATVTHREILMKQILNPKITEETVIDYLEKDVYSIMETHFMDNYARIEDRFHKEYPDYKPQKPVHHVGNGNDSTSVYMKGEDSIRLPKISLERFSGDYRKWPTFYDLFRTLVHENESLSDVQKLQYLKLHLSGEAESLLRHFSVTGKNYNTAWDLLKDRYDNKRVLVNAHLKTLLSQTGLSSETANGIKVLLDTTTESLQALNNLDISTEGWDVLIVYLTVQKLPSETHSLWEQKLANKADLPTWKELQEFLKGRFRTLEAITVKKHPAVSKDHRNYSFRSKGTTQTFLASSSSMCYLCGNQHHIRQCSKFTSMNFTKKLETVKTKGLCINCLGLGHMLAQCPSKQKCLHCKQRHHTLLHRNSNEQHQASTSNRNLVHDSSFQSHRKPTMSSSSTNSSTEQILGAQSSLIASSPEFIPQQSDRNSPQVSSFFINDLHETSEILLATAMVKVIASSGKEEVFRALIDQGSQASFVTEAAIQALNLPKEAIRANVSGIGESSAGQVNARVHLSIKALNSDAIKVEVKGLVLKKLTHLLPPRKLRIQDWEHIRGLQLADPLFYKPGKIDLLLGADIYSKIIENGVIKGKPGSPVAQQTILGWILTGEISNYSFSSTVRNFHILADLESQLKRFWELEEVINDKVLTDEEKRCEDIFAAQHKRLEDGRYEVSLPLNDPEGAKSLGESRFIAVASLHQMEKRFKTNPLLQTEYSKCIKEYATLEHMKPIELKEESINDSITNSYVSCYLPHHSVIKADSSTTKLRVVFDASRKTSSRISLNDIMLKGPTIQDELACLLLRWRKYRIAFTADIEKMYRQVRINPKQADLQRIVWRESPDTAIRDYQLLTVTFGTKSAPYLATRVLKQLALDEKVKYPIGSQATLSEFYVDDLLSGGDNLACASEKQTQLINLLKSGGFHLRKWASNSSRLLENIPEEHIEVKVALNVDGGEQVKALGLYWDPSTDALCYSIKLDKIQEVCTKRTILSDVAKLFDPLGWASPSIIIAKIFIQKLWLAKLDWDEAVPSNIENQWLEFRKNIIELRTINLPRWIQYLETNHGIEIHGFCDASLVAFAAVIYISVIDLEGNRKVSILSAKSKVAPIRTVSLPRLELCGAVLLAKLLRYVLKSLAIADVSLYAWTDSEIVLAWLRGHPSKWKTFIANRVSHIHELIGEAVWHHVPTKENPADYATRGIMPTELKSCSLWWNGPIWLGKHKNCWPKKNDIPETNMEIRKLAVNCMQTTIDRMEDRYSSLNKLLNITAYCHRFKSKQKGHLKANEIRTALSIWLKNVQFEHFSEEIQQLRNGKPLESSNRLLKLSPYLHSDGLLRVGGRLQYADLSYNEKHPIILPDKGHLTHLIIDKVHKDTLHGGPQLMMRVIAQKYWLLNARNAIRQHIHKCVQCTKQRAEIQTQLMGNLPRPRVTKSRPFSHVGVDYCGPFNIRRHRGRGSNTYKGYVSIFVCMAVKAIHIEVVTDLSAEGFIAAFRRFASRRGLPSDVYCDCGSNFGGGYTILTRQNKQMVDQLNEEIASLIETQGVRFHFIPPASPHFGGLWESGVRSTKYHMKRILGNSILTYEELATVLTQIEACLNSRPLCPSSNDPDDLNSLTPAHFLIGDILLTPPEPSVLDINVHRLDRWQHIQRLHQHFWKRWHTEYLCLLQQRPKWKRNKKNLKNGDLVIIKEENLPPSRWLLGRIIATHPGSDGLVRVATIKTKDSILKRPAAKLCLLPIENSEI